MAESPIPTAFPLRKIGLDMSLLVPVAVGIAAENKKLSSKELEIFPTEMRPFADGEIVINATQVTDTGIDGNGQTYNVNLTMANSIVATWLPFGSNRKSAPDIRRGEKVYIYQYSDADKYYWRPLGLDDHLRRLETVILVFSATKDESTTELTPDNSYYFEISTHNKSVTFSTSKANGEPYAYTFQLNTADGVYTLTDDDGNFVELDSSERSITAQNKDESYIQLNKQNIFIEAAKLIQAKTELFHLICKKMHVEADVFYGDIKESTLTGTLHVMKNVTMDMNLNVTMLATVGSLAAAGGAMTVSSAGAINLSNSPVTHSGTFTSTGSIIHNGKSIGIDHQHPNGNGGSPTGGVM